MAERSALSTLESEPERTQNWKALAPRVIETPAGAKLVTKFSKLTGADAPLVTTPEWMERNKEALEGKILRMPERSDIEFEVEEHLIVELYSK